MNTDYLEGQKWAKEEIEEFSYHYAVGTYNDYKDPFFRGTYTEESQQKIKGYCDEVEKYCKEHGITI